jgi:CIC family chloride channel protein
VTNAAGTAEEKKSETSPPPRPESGQTGWRRLIYESDAWLITAAVFIGVIAALASFLFHGAIAGAHGYFWGDLGGALGIGAQHVTDDVFRDGLGSLPTNWWLVPLIPMFGMSLIMLLDYWFPGEIKGYGLPRFLEIVNFQGGYIKRRWITLKTLSAAITLGSGMSTGIEGPIAQIGGSLGSTVGRVMRPSAERLRVLIACGSAAAVSATFQSPIAGVMFAQEIVLMGSAQMQSLSLLVLSSGTATVVSAMVSGEHGELHAPEFHFPLNHELLFYVLMGLLCGFLATAFVRSFYAIKDWAIATAIPDRILPLIAGLAMGIVIVFFPQVRGSGYETMNAAFEGNMGGALLLSLAFLKILMTGITLGLGGAGGVFAPAMFIGAVFGGGYAGFVNWLLPGTIAHTGAFALVGMGAFLAAATHAPMTAIFLLFELTHQHDVVLPIMITAITALLVARQVFPESIDHYELHRRGLDLNPESEANILRKLYVRGLVKKDFQVIPESMVLSELMNYVTSSHHSHFPVVNDDGELVGLIGMGDLRGILLERDSWPFVVVSELAQREVEPVRLNDNLFDAMQAFSARGLELLPVVDDETGKKVVGVLRLADLQNFYQKRLLAREIEG